MSPGRWRAAKTLESDAMLFRFLRALAASIGGWLRPMHLPGVIAAIISSAFFGVLRVMAFPRAGGVKRAARKRRTRVLPRAKGAALGASPLMCWLHW